MNLIHDVTSKRTERRLYGQDRRRRFSEGLLNALPERRPGGYCQASYLLGQLEPEFNLSGRQLRVATVQDGRVLPLLHSGNGSADQFGRPNDLSDVAHISIHSDSDLQNYAALDASTFRCPRISWLDAMYKLFISLLGFQPHFDRNDCDVGWRSCIRQRNSRLRIGISSLTKSRCDLVSKLIPAFDQQYLAGRRD